MFNINAMDMNSDYGDGTNPVIPKSEFILSLCEQFICGSSLGAKQKSTDRIELAKLLNISDIQMSYITNVGAGQGLLKVGSSLVLFANKFPRSNELYKLMPTKFSEV